MIEQHVPCRDGETVCKVGVAHPQNMEVELSVQMIPGYEFSFGEESSGSDFLQSWSQKTND